MTCEFMLLQSGSGFLAHTSPGAVIDTDVSKTHFALPVLLTGSYLTGF